MTSDTTYNGWTNYATWRVNLEICDDYLDSRAEDGQTWPDTIALADELEDMVGEVITGFGEISDETLAVQYAQAFVSQVNYYEIAATFRADNPDLFEDEEDDD